MHQFIKAQGGHSQEFTGSWVEKIVFLFYALLFSGMACLMPLLTWNENKEYKTIMQEGEATIGVITIIHYRTFSYEITLNFKKKKNE